MPIAVNLPKTVSIRELRSNRWTSLPKVPGIYWWFFPPSCLESFRITDHCDKKSLRILTNEAGNLCLYIGTSKNLNNRTKWHAEQALAQPALETGFLSTFRKTLLALSNIDFATGFDRINAFMDGLDICWQATESLEVAKDMEAKELDGDYHFPLNIQGNKSTVLIPFLKYLKRQRKEYVTKHLAAVEEPAAGCFVDAGSLHSEAKQIPPVKLRTSDLELTKNVSKKRGPAPPIVIQTEVKANGFSVPDQLYLVSCVGKKLSRAALAKDIYISAWFKKARSYVESKNATWLILSAKYGVVNPNAFIEPYEVTLNSMAKSDRRTWGETVLAELTPYLKPKQSITILAGERYREFIEDSLRTESRTVLVPMAGLRIGEQLKWLMDALLNIERLK